MTVIETVIHKFLALKKPRDQWPNTSVALVQGAMTVCGLLFLIREATIGSRQ